MANQISPAQQDEKTASRHLAQPEARFLGATPETRQGHGTCRAIVFLMDNPELSWITQDLCRILTQRGHNSMLYRLDETTDSGQAVHKRAGECEYRLLATTSIAAVEEYNFDRVVLLVPANLEAVLAAYQRIKRLARRNTPDIGIVLVGPHDQHSAWRFFRRLAIGALRYLDIPLLNLGFLPAQITPEHGPANQHRNNFLARIGERLLRSEFFSAYPVQQIDRDRTKPEFLTTKGTKLPTAIVPVPIDTTRRLRLKNNRL